MTVKWGEMKWNSWSLVKLDRENQQKDLLSSIKSQSLYSYKAFRPTDLFPNLKDLLIVLIVLKSLDTSMRVHIRISCVEFRQWSVWVTRPHVLHELTNLRRFCFFELRRIHQYVCIRNMWQQMLEGDVTWNSASMKPLKERLVSFGTRPFELCGPRTAWRITTITHVVVGDTPHFENSVTILL